MHSHTRSHPPIFGRNWSPANAALTTLLTLLLLILLFLTLTALPARGQTYQILYNFTGGQDGAYPDSLILGPAGTLYGTTNRGSLGYGTVFKFGRGSLNALYSFSTSGTGFGSLLLVPWHSIEIGPDGSLYGTQKYGGGGSGWGTVFNLRPPATACTTALCPWTQDLLYQFKGGSDGAYPTGALSFDPAGKIYGATLQGGTGVDCNPSPCGTVYELTPAHGTWTESVIHNFTNNGDDGGFPTSGGLFDADGNLYGSALAGGDFGNGVVFKLTPSGSGWQYSSIYAFQGSNDGYLPYGNLVFDLSGSLYGSTGWGGANNAGTVFRLLPSGSGWTFGLLYPFVGPPTLGVPDYVNLTMDNAGNLYGTTYGIGAYGWGSVFKLSPGNGFWTFTSLHDFCGDGGSCADGANPLGIALDSAGNLYGVASSGGANGRGLIWEITP